MVAVLSGLFHIASGGLILRTQRLGVWIILMLTAVQAGSVIMSWDQWDSYAAEEVLKRREYQGLPVRPGHVEFMQRLVPEALIGVLALQLAAALYAASRFSDRARS